MLSARTPSQPEVVLTADVEPGSADDLLDVLAELEVGTHEYVLTQARRGRPDHRRAAEDAGARRSGFAWLEVLGEARAHARPLARYLVLMAIAGVIAGARGDRVELGADRRRDGRQP